MSTVGKPYWLVRFTHKSGGGGYFVATGQLWAVLQRNAKRFNDRHDAYARLADAKKENAPYCNSTTRFHVVRVYPKQPGEQS